MKKIFAIASAFVLLFSLTACNGASSAPAASKAPSASAAPEGSQPAAEAGYTVAISMNALDEYQTEWLGYLTTFLEEKGCEVVTTNAEGKVDKQISDVEALIQKKPDVIVMRAVDSEGAIPAFEAITAAGIPVVDAELDVKYDGAVHLVSPQLVMGQLQGEWLNNYLAENPDFKATVGYIWGYQGMSATTDRYNGFVDTMTGGPNADRFEIKVEKVCNWSATETMAAVEDWMQAFPEINLIVAQSDEMAIAAVNVIMAANRKDEVKVIGIDGSPNAQESIRNGELTGSSFRSRIVSAKNCAEGIVMTIRGELKPGDEFLTSEGADAFLTIDNVDTAVKEIEGGMM